MSDLPPSDEELKQARALAEDLERHVPSGGAHEDVLGTALMLRNSVNDGLDEVGLARARPKRREAFSWKWAPYSAGAAAILLLIAFMAHEALSPVPSANPDAALHAQALAIANHDPSSLEPVMRRYRTGMLFELERRYGDSP